MQHCPGSVLFVSELHSPNARSGAYARRNSAKKDLFGAEFGAEVHVEKKEKNPLRPTSIL